MTLPGSTIRAFTADQVCGLAGISKRQLAYWDATGFFSPRPTHDRPHAAYGRIYSFRDVVGLRTIAKLRARVSLQELRKVGEYLRENFETPWSSLRFFVGSDGRVYFQEPGREIAFEAKKHGQGDYIIVNLEDVAAEMDVGASALRERKKSELGLIRKNRYVVHNDAVLAGTRVPTRAVWSFHEGGYSAEKIRAEYPRLTIKDINAAIRYERQRQKKRRAG